MFEAETADGIWSALGATGGTGAGHWTDVPDTTLTWRAGGDPIYFGNALPDGNGTFEQAGYVHIWCTDPVLVARFIGRFITVRALVDPRCPDGMVVDAESFVQQPVPTCSAW